MSASSLKFNFNVNQKTKLVLTAEFTALRCRRVSSVHCLISTTPVADSSIAVFFVSVANIRRTKNLLPGEFIWRCTASPSRSLLFFASQNFQLCWPKSSLSLNACVNFSRERCVKSSSDFLRQLFTTSAHIYIFTTRKAEI